ncbi:hypothetical protein QTO34_003638 [Cnephaeus nilssonii]|uniref:Membrane spanning 4-domains A8 n=1 Tax=Cnephaeus nilssonii TaxID=3371016 RepID=A0AA40HRX4_CNENI|nr:hypothetical protein QTO34_003638 [Eptesicus nilssonii]
MTLAGPTANSVFVMAPHNRYPVIPGSMSQVPVSPLNQPQVQQMPGNPPNLEPRRSMQPAQRSFKEAKVLGASQILIGLIHICLGSIMGTIMPGPYTAVSFYGGYPFWGGILLKSSMGLSIASAICSIVGILLLITDMVINSLYRYTDPYHYLGVAFGVATSAVLFIFSLLEFCIACTSAHFGCKLVCYSHNNGTVVFQTVYVTHPVANPEPVNSPPSYSSEDQDS